MSESQPAVGNMSRDELENRVHELEAAVEDLRDLSGKRTAETNKRMSGIEEQLEDLQTAVSNHGDTLATIADVESEKSSEEEKLGAIVAYADKARGSASKTLVTPKEIAGATGCSKRYAYDLVDKIGGLNDEGNGAFDEGEYPWAAVRESTTVPTANGAKKKAKALKIDFDRVQRNPDALNWFNNGSRGNGAE